MGIATVEQLVLQEIKTHRLMRKCFQLDLQLGATTWTLSADTFSDARWSAIDDLVRLLNILANANLYLYQELRLLR